jgi:putative DNA methylase
VRSQLAAQRGGADTIFNAPGERIGGAYLLAVVTLKPGQQGRLYRLPAERDYDATLSAQAAVAKLSYTKLENGLSVIPDEPTPKGGGSGAGRAFSIFK